MILVDTALRKRAAEGNPIRVGMVGAGFMARGTALQMLQVTPGIDLVAISNRHLEGARQAYQVAGVDDVLEVHRVDQLNDAIRAGRYAITEDPMLLCRADLLDVVLEITGAIEFGAQVAMETIRHGKHILQMNAELDGTLGPILKTYADRENVIFSFTDGDQPGVTMNLYRFVRGMGVQPVMCGNIKGLHDPYRNPTTQIPFARKWKQKPHMVASFADGSKISYEQAIVANGTGMRVARRGMYGPVVETGTPLLEAIQQFPPGVISQEGPGVVDYLVGASPAPGVFVVGTHDHPLQQHYLNLYKLGEGPFYLFYTPYHLCHFEIPNTVARAVIFGDATLAPLAGPRVDVVAAAKIDLRQGQEVDGIGYYMTYGLAENADVAFQQKLLPLGLAEGCRLRRDVARDQVLTYDDVELPAGRLCDRLRGEQDERFFGQAPEVHMAAG